MKGQKMDWVIYSCCDKNYFRFALTALRIASLMLPDIPHKCVLICNSREAMENDLNKLVAGRWDIELRFKDLEEKYAKLQQPSGGFRDNAIGQWPQVCFYIFDSPQEFFHEGCEYSMYIDADVVCARKIHRLPHLAANCAYAAKAKKFDSLPNSGVVFFNNRVMHEYQLTNLIDQLIHEGQKFGSDQDVYAHFCKSDTLPFLQLSDKWNYIIHMDEDRMRNFLNHTDNIRQEDILIYHLLPKPWRTNRSNPLLRYASSFDALGAFDLFHETYLEFENQAV